MEKVKQLSLFEQEKPETEIDRGIWIGGKWFSTKFLNAAAAANARVCLTPLKVVTN